MSDKRALPCGSRADLKDEAMASELLKTFYGLHDEVTVYKESGPFSLKYVVYRGSSQYNTFSSLRDAMRVAEELGKRR